jgi:L-lactate permease
MKNSAMFITGVITVVLTILIVSAIFAWPIQMLWNYCLVGAVNGVNPIGFWQALGLLILFTLLFTPKTTQINKDEK